MTQKPSILPAGMKLEGNVEGDVDFVVLGVMVGEVSVSGALVIEEGGAVFGPVRARTIVVRGSLRGDAVATDTVRIEPTARVEGDAVAPKVNVLEGARIRGRIEPVVQDGTPRVVRAKKARRASAAAASPASWTTPGTLSTPPPASEPTQVDTKSPAAPAPKHVPSARATPLARPALITPVPSNQPTLVGAPVAELRAPTEKIRPTPTVVVPEAKLAPVAPPATPVAPPAAPLASVVAATAPVATVAAIAAAPVVPQIVAAPPAVRRPPAPRIPAIRRSEARRGDEAKRREGNS